MHYIIDTTNGSEASFQPSLAEQDYRNANGISQSSVKEFLRSPAHYLASTEAVQEPTAAMRFGTVFHSELLCDNPSDSYVVMPAVDGRTKEGKELKAKFELESKGKVVIKEDDLVRIQAMKRSVLDHPMASSILQFADFREASLFASYKVDSENKIRLKGRLDGINLLRNCVFDLKTCEDASPEGFRKAIWNLKYDIQVVQYLWLARVNGIEVDDFVFIAIEKEPPFAVACYRINPKSLVRSIETWNNAIRGFSECWTSGNWHGYSEAIEELSL